MGSFHRDQPDSSWINLVWSLNRKDVLALRRSGVVVGFQSFETEVSCFLFNMSVFQIKMVTGQAGDISIV